ncbi:MAG: type II toxin-antitoxin system RelE/ParE family toxin [Chlorobium sp.]
MPNNPFRIQLSSGAENDLKRIEEYAVLLETRNRRILALSNAVLSLKKSWQLFPCFDRDRGVCVCYVEGWYSVFYRVDEKARQIVVIAIPGQAEDLNKVPV